MDLRLAPLASGAFTSGNESGSPAPDSVADEGPWTVRQAAGETAADPRLVAVRIASLALNPESIPVAAAPSGRVALAGEAGGFPLLGAAAFGPVRFAGADFATFNLVQADAAEEVDPLDAAAPDPIGPSMKARDMTISLFSTSGIVTAWSLNALFSQPAAGFDSLKTYFDARRGEEDKEAGKASARHAASTRPASTIRRFRRSGRPSTQRM
jgi:hypothetical protein